MKEIIINESSDVYPIRLVLHQGDLAFDKPLIIFCHGFKGFANWGFFPFLGKNLSALGWNFVRFDFTLNGTEPDFPNDFTQLARFSENTFGRELTDLERVMKWAEQQGLAANGFLLVGHSRGGGISIIKTAEDSRVKGLITLAAVSNFEKRLAVYHRQEWMDRGYVNEVNGRTGQVMPLGLNLLLDFERNALRYDISSASKKITVPWLILHGAKDVVVLPEEALWLNSLARNSDVKIMADAGHTFEALHPFDENSVPEAIFRLVETMALFFADNQF